MLRRNATPETTDEADPRPFPAWPWSWTDRLRPARRGPAGGDPRPEAALGRGNAGAEREGARHLQGRAVAGAGRAALGDAAHHARTGAGADDRARYGLRPG